MTTTQTNQTSRKASSKEVQANPENNVEVKSTKAKASESKATSDTKAKASDLKVSTTKETTKQEKNSDKKGDDMISVNNAEKTTGRNFYAIKPNKSGKDVAYAFERIAERNEWMTKNEDAKPVTALEVYQMLNKSSHDALIANRNKRVYKVKSDETIDVKKGQRLIRC